MALTTKVLRLVNSAFYRTGREVTSIHHAVVVLGARSIRNLTLSFNVLGVFPHKREKDFDFQVFWEKSLRRAVLCRLLAQESRSSSGDEAMTVALLLDIGMPVLQQYFPQEYGSLRVLTLDAEAQCASERALFGADHATVGGALCRKWSLPAMFMRLITHHHDPKPRGLVGEEEQIWKLCTLADVLADLYRLVPTEERLRYAALRAQGDLGIAPPDLQVLLARANDEVAEAAKQFGLGFTPEHKSIRLARETVPGTGPATATDAGAMASVPGVFSAAVARPADDIAAAVAGGARDAQTGLHTVAFFGEALRWELHRLGRYRRPFVLLSVRVDRGGLDACDDALLGDPEFIRRVARRLRLRRSDLMARVSEDTLVALCIETQATHGPGIAERLRQSLAKDPIQLGEHLVRVTASVGGIACGPKLETDDPGALLQAVEEAVFRARLEGGNRSVFWTDW